MSTNPLSSLKTRLASVIRNFLRRSLQWFIRDVRYELKAELRTELKTELRTELKTEIGIEHFQFLLLLNTLSERVEGFVAALSGDTNVEPVNVDMRAEELRRLVRSTAGLAPEPPEIPMTEDLLMELLCLRINALALKPAFEALQSQRVLFCGQAYYNAWYLSRALRSLGWKADVYNWDENPMWQIYYHGQDFKLGEEVPATVEASLEFYLSSIYGYDVIHFSNANSISYGWRVTNALTGVLGEGGEIHLLKALGKKIVYSNNGCLDGVSQTAFSRWGPESVCSICWAQHEPSVCSDERNLAWGKFRNSVADYQCTLGGNRADYNDDPRVHEVPEFYCLDPEFWRPDIEIPKNYRLPPMAEGGVRLYHAVGHREMRTRNGVNIKSSHVYLPLVERLRAEGMALDLIEPTGIPNKEVRFLQAQADIFLDMLTFGWFGANVREAMMLAKPVICFIRPEWLESVRKEIPDYAEELPIISATPQTVEFVLRDLIAHPQKREEIGKRSREFAVKWHSKEVAGRRFDRIYLDLLKNKQP